MRAVPMGIEGCWKIEHDRFEDDRGWFQESYRSSLIHDLTGASFEPRQTNLSRSRIGTVRGIHYSLAPGGQMKLVTVVRGAIDDYVIDLRPWSSTFGNWERIRLSADSPRSVLLDGRVGHAFESLEDETTVSYLTNSEYDPTSEKSINPRDTDLNIDWKSSTPRISVRDMEAPSLRHQEESGMLPIRDR